MAELNQIEFPGIGLEISDAELLKALDELAQYLPEFDWKVNRFLEGRLDKDKKEFSNRSLDKMINQLDQREKHLWHPSQKISTRETSGMDPSLKNLFVVHKEPKRTLTEAEQKCLTDIKKIKIKMDEIAKLILQP